MMVELTRYIFPVFVQYSTDRDGSVMGVTVSRNSMLVHCRAITQACNYTEGENMVCVLDFKRETGLWHSVLASVLNGMHVIFIPYALMKVNPASWMQMITKHKGTYGRTFNKFQCCSELHQTSVFSLFCSYCCHSEIARPPLGSAGDQGSQRHHTGFAKAVADRRWREPMVVVVLRSILERVPAERP